MCRHQGSSEQSGSYTTPSSFLWLNRTLFGITWQYTPLIKNNSAENEGFLFGSLPPPTCQKRGRILNHCVPDELTRTRILLSKISTPFLTFLISFFPIKGEYCLFCKPRLVQCKNIERWIWIPGKMKTGDQLKTKQKSEKTHCTF